MRIVAGCVLFLLLNLCAAWCLAATEPVEEKYPIRVILARFDEPIPWAAYDGLTRRAAVRVPGPDAVDWPQLHLADGTPLFHNKSTEKLEAPLKTGAASKAMFHRPDDLMIEPVGHWFRAHDWLWGQKYIQTTERDARGTASEYELWAFPVLIKPEGGTLASVALRIGDEVIYDRSEITLQSLTLLLPTNLGGKPYELTVNGRPALKFDVALQPVTLGDPQEEAPVKLDLVVPGDGPRVRVMTPAGPPPFADQKEWDADVKAMAAFVPDGTAPTPPPAWDAAAPLPSVSVFTMAMVHGMSGGHYFGGDYIASFKGTPEEYAAHLANVGFDCDYEFLSDDSWRKREPEYRQWLAALARQGIRGGINFKGYGAWGMIAHPNIAFHSYCLAEWHRPLFRGFQLLAQQFCQNGNFAGVMSGADNAGYTPYWNWAPPMPNRPWGRSLEIFQQGKPLVVPVAAGIPLLETHEITAPTHAAFLDYVHRYDQSFGQYGYFARSVSDIDPRLTYTTASLGSSPGVGGRGGWPWATIPAKPIFADVPLQLAYDWNELSSSMPMHNVALVDRLRSYFPDKPTWSLIDDFNFLFGREARQRAYMLVLTRGVQGVGTNVLAHTTGDENFRSEPLKQYGQVPRPRAAVIAEQKELFAWIHRYGGVYSVTHPLATIGILYINDQAISRPVLKNLGADPNEIYRGSHEGKTTEALFLCHAAGWPAKIVTPEELQRGLPAEMKALLLVGLNRFDQSWTWSDGLEPALQQFVAGGGRILVDDESVSPVPAVQTGIRVAAYTKQATLDETPMLLERNRDNCAKLREALKDLPAPVATSDDPTIWAVPTQAGNTQYVTVVNQAAVPLEPGVKSTRIDPAIDFSWDDCTPDAALSPDGYAVIWTGAIQAPGTGKYRFKFAAAGRATMSFNDKPLLPGTDAAAQDAGVVTLEQGHRYDVRIEYQHTGGPAKIKLQWGEVGKPAKTVPAEAYFNSTDAAAPAGLHGSYEQLAGFRNASRYVRPQVGTLAWHTDRPIYDVRLHRRLTADEAKRVDLTADGFQWYALPVAQVSQPKLTLSRNAVGDVVANVAIGDNQALTGIPFEISVPVNDTSPKANGATGLPVTLARSAALPQGTILRVTELLSGLSVEAAIATDAVHVDPAKPNTAAMAIASLSSRSTVPLVIALTPQQRQDLQTATLAQRLMTLCHALKRDATLGTAAPGDVVRSLQTLQATQRYPQWMTVDADLLLLGSPQDNVLILDQQRGGLLSRGQSPAIDIVHSPFVGERNAINLCAQDAAGLENLVAALEQAARAQKGN